MSKRLRLILLSFLKLFVELALIRWKTAFGAQALLVLVPALSGISWLVGSRGSRPSPA